MSLREYSEAIAARRLRELTSEVGALHTENHFLHAKADENVAEIHRSNDKESEMVTRNEALTMNIHRLQEENQKVRDTLAKSSQTLAEQIRSDEEKEAELTRDGNAIRQDNVQLHNEENELTANRSTLIKRMREEKEKEATLKEDLKTLEDADAKYKDRAALVGQLRKVSDGDAVLRQEVQLLKTENGKLLRSEERNQAWITKLKSILTSEREKRFEADDNVNKHQEGMKSIEAKRRSEKALLVSKALTAEEQVSAQNSLVVSLQKENEKLKAQLRAITVEAGDLQERHEGLKASTVKAVKLAPRTHVDMESDADAELERLHYELRGRLRNQGA